MVQLKRKVTLRTKENVEQAPQPPTLQKDPKPSSGQGKWWIAMAVVLLLVGLGVYFYRHNASTAEKAVAEAAVGSTQGVDTALTTSKAEESNEASASAQSAANQVQTKGAEAGQAGATAQDAAPAAVKAGASETPASVAQTPALAPKHFWPFGASAIAFLPKPRRLPQRRRLGNRRRQESNRRCPKRPKVLRRKRRKCP